MKPNQLTSTETGTRQKEMSGQKTSLHCSGVEKLKKAVKSCGC